MSSARKVVVIAATLAALIVLNYIFEYGFGDFYINPSYARIITLYESLHADVLGGIGEAEAGDLLHAVDRVRQITEEGGTLADAAEALIRDLESAEVESVPLEPGRTDVVRLMNSGGSAACSPSCTRARRAAAMRACASGSCSNTLTCARLNSAMAYCGFDGGTRSSWG